MDWSDFGAALVAAVVAAGGVLEAKRRPSGSRTRATDVSADELIALTSPELGDDAETRESAARPGRREQLRREPDAGWARRRFRR